MLENEPGLKMRRLAVKQNAEFTEASKNEGPIFSCLWTKIDKNFGGI